MTSKLVKTIQSVALTLLMVWGVTQIVDVVRFSQQSKTVLTTVELNEVSRLLPSVQYQQWQDGQPLLIYVWATWCIYCKATSGAASDLSIDLPVVSIALQSGDTATLTAFADKKGYRFPIYADNRGAFSQALDVSVTPTFLIVNAKGKILFKTSGINSELGLRGRLAWYKTHQ